MQLEAAHISAIITAVAGITGVLLGNFFLVIKEWGTSRKKNAKETAYLAILVVSHLDRFANGCMHVAHDDGTEEGRPAGDGEYHMPTVSAPTFSPLDIDVQWKVLPKQLMYEILQIPDKREQIQNHLDGVREFDGPPDYTEYFWERRSGYAELGLYVSSVAKKLRKHAGMPMPEITAGDWDRDKSMQGVIEQIRKRREAHEKKQAEISSGLL